MTQWCRKVVCFLVGHVLHWDPALNPTHGRCETCGGIFPFRD